jgi:hypothetical protein
MKTMGKVWEVLTRARKRLVRLLGMERAGTA